MSPEHALGSCPDCDQSGGPDGPPVPWTVHTARRSHTRLFLALALGRLEVKHLEQSRRRALCCAGCGTGVAWEGDVFTLPGAEGVVGAYVNPMGYVHQVSC